MTYILIAVIFSLGSSRAMTTVEQEFNTLQACQATAAEIRKQLKDETSLQAPVVLCAAKGEKK